ncbi:MAG: bifunctional histidinol-phosphatase/imidazoleglycerol-phosphate dehydratase HisB [Crocinitomicaceae bacterium]|nr:bifunctional histidinol-phosphatase/imidazoleglycerol-phosphate dehydratase HisB [Crocinitomicaceae bacterium]
MKKVLFIDRDGTLVIEPPVDYQLDSLEKLEFYPGVFQWLSKIALELDYELVMVTNQDGLGTKSFPENTFWPAQNKIIEAFKNEGVEFDEILIDRSFPEDNAPTRKPEIGLLTKYVYGDYEMKDSYVIGDRESDLLLAKNLGAEGIYIGDLNEVESSLTTTNWKEVYRFLKAKPRKSKRSRVTNETEIKIEVNLDGTGQSRISTGIGFFDHMLEQIAKHGKIDLDVDVQGDLEIDEHHTIEDVAITLGEALNEALGAKKGIQRYGFLLPMDDCLAQVAIDFGGRPWLVWDVNFKREMIGEMPTEMFMHFFKSFSDGAKCNLNIKAQGANEHHKIEAIFKALARAIKSAVTQTDDYSIPSTKGTL